LSNTVVLLAFLLESFRNQTAVEYLRKFVLRSHVKQIREDFDELITSKSHFAKPKETRVSKQQENARTAFGCDALD